MPGYVSFCWIGTNDVRVCTYLDHLFRPVASNIENVSFVKADLGVTLSNLTPTHSIVTLFLYIISPIRSSPSISAITTPQTKKSTKREKTPDQSLVFSHQWHAGLPKMQSPPFRALTTSHSVWVHSLPRTLARRGEKVKSCNHSHPRIMRPQLSMNRSALHTKKYAWRSLS